MLNVDPFEHNNVSFSFSLWRKCLLQHAKVLVISCWFPYFLLLVLVTTPLLPVFIALNDGTGDGYTAETKSGVLGQFDASYRVPQCMSNTNPSNRYNITHTLKGR